MENNSYKKDVLEDFGQEQGSNLDIKKWFYKLLSFWWLFLISLLLAVSGAYLYLRYSIYQYEARATLLVKTGNIGISEQQILAPSEGLVSGGKFMTNEIEILKSRTMMEKVVERLGINVQYFKLGRIKDKELYPTSPIILDSFYIDKDDLPFDLLISVIDQDSFDVYIDEEVTLRGEFGKPLQHGMKYFLIDTQSSLSENQEQGDYRIRVSSKIGISSKYRSRIKVNHIGDQYSSGVLEIGLRSPVPEKAEDIINTLIQVYNIEEVNDENRVLRNTLDFIDKRLLSLEQELEEVEGNIELFKKNNVIVAENPSDNADIILQQLSTLERQLAEQEIKREILNSLEKSLLDDKFDEQLIPANLIAEGGNLSTLVSQYNNLVLNYRRFKGGVTEQNPNLIALEQQLGELKRTILVTIQNLEKETSFPIAQTKKDIQRINNTLRNIPSKERALIDRKRQQIVKENLYLFLLQKREETALSEAITTPNTRIIDSAMATVKPVSPQPNLYYLTSSFLGLLFPLGIILLLEFLNDKITSEDQLKRTTSIPIVGRIGLSKDKSKIVVKKGSRSAIAEMFRLIRTNLNFMNPEHEKQVIVTTSSQSGEGKTFITINLGLALALSDKKVVIIGLDLRKPKLFQYLGIDNNNFGLTNYLIGEATIAEILHKSGHLPNLDFIISGPTPPNPAELILTDRIKNLINTLKEEYDYILIDTPPIGLVTDALLFNPYATNTLVVIRHGVTKIDMVKVLNNYFLEGKLKKPGIILNGINTGKGYGYQQYGYGYGYYTND